MKRCLNSWSLLAFFFMMAMLYAMGPIQGNPIESQKCDVVCTVHSPPMLDIAIMNEKQINQNVLWISTSMPGVQQWTATTTCKVDIQGMQINNNFYTKKDLINRCNPSIVKPIDATARNGSN